MWRNTTRGLAALTLAWLLAGCGQDAPEGDAAPGPADGASERGSPADATADDPTPAADLIPGDHGSYLWNWVGEPCDEVGDCPNSVSDDLCLMGGEWEWPGGYCSAPCDPTRTDQCPVGSHCEELVTTGTNITTCIRDCSTDADCRDGYLCAPIPGEAAGGCVPFS